MVVDGGDQPAQAESPGEFMADLKPKPEIIDLNAALTRLGVAIEADPARGSIDNASMLSDGLEDDPIRWCHAMAAKIREIAAQRIRPEVKAEAIVLAEQYESLAARLISELGHTTKH